MSGMLGMNVESARSDLATVQAWVGILEAAERQLSMARLLSGAGLLPGTLVVAPFSTINLAQAQADIDNAGDAIGYLMARLREEIGQQEGVSGSLVPTDPGWFVIPISAQRPTSDANLGTVLLGDTFTRYDLIQVPWALVAEWGTIFKNAPEFAKEVAKWSGWMGKMTKLIPLVGAVTSSVETYVVWGENEEDGYTWGNVRNAIGTGLAWAEVLGTLIFPPAGAVIATVGVVWDVMDLVWDLGDEFWW